MTSEAKTPPENLLDLVREIREDIREVTTKVSAIEKSLGVLADRTAAVEADVNDVTKAMNRLIPTIEEMESQLEGLEVWIESGTRMIKKPATKVGRGL